jgi:hypothetical protein
MSTAQSPWQKRENFPITTFMFLDRSILILRNKIMEEAAEMAEQESPPKEVVYTVEEKHVKAVLEKMGLAQLLS